jgi:D-3-phosphoglycerate dehydrogenase
VLGLLQQINTVFGINHINIAPQYLQTSGDIGYVVIDIDAAHSDVALASLGKVTGTIRSRVLF